MWHGLITYSALNDYSLHSEILESVQPVQYEQPKQPEKRRSRRKRLGMLCYNSNHSNHIKSQSSINNQHHNLHVNQSDYELCLRKIEAWIQLYPRSAVS